jgi:Cu+-exporting ATPase
VRSADLVVLVIAALTVPAFSWYFFCPRRAPAAQLGGGLQLARVTVHGGCRPNILQVRQGLPAESTVRRPETAPPAWCSQTPGSTPPRTPHCAAPVAEL